MPMHCMVLPGNVMRHDSCPQHCSADVASSRPVPEAWAPGVQRLHAVQFHVLSALFLKQPATLYYSERELYCSTVCNRVIVVLVSPAPYVLAWKPASEGLPVQHRPTATCG